MKTRNVKLVTASLVTLSTIAVIVTGIVHANETFYYYVALQSILTLLYLCVYCNGWRIL